MELSSLLRFKANFLICKLVVRKPAVKIDGKVFEKIRGTVNYYVNQFKEIGKLALSTPHKRPFTIFSIFQGPRAKMEEAGLHLPARLAGALCALALSGALSASWELESVFSSARPVCYLPHLRA